MTAEEIHMGVSGLRTMCSTTLRALDKIVILHDRAQPIAALIPYSVYMEWQETHKRLHEAMEAYR